MKAIRFSPSQVPYLQLDMLAKTLLYPPDNSPCVYVSVCTVPTENAFSLPTCANLFTFCAFCW